MEHQALFSLKDKSKIIIIIECRLLHFCMDLSELKYHTRKTKYLVLE